MVALAEWERTGFRMKTRKRTALLREVVTETSMLLMESHVVVVLSSRLTAHARVYARAHIASVMSISLARVDVVTTRWHLSRAPVFARLCPGRRAFLRHISLRSLRYPHHSMTATTHTHRPGACFAQNA